MALSQGGARVLILHVHPISKQRPLSPLDREVAGSLGELNSVDRDPALQSKSPSAGIRPARRAAADAGTAHVTARASARRAAAHPPARRSHAHACRDVQPWRPREPHCELRHALHTARTQPPETRTCAGSRPIAPSRTHARCSHRVDAQTAHGRCWRRNGSGVGGEMRRRSRYARILRLTRRPAPQN